MKLAIADPPYPPIVAERRDLADGGVRITTRSRARRWYGAAYRAEDTGKPADFHVDAGEWDDPARHRALLEELVAGYDGWAIATTPDGIRAYGDLPLPCRILAWVKPNGLPGGHRLRSTWEAVILYPPEGARSRAAGMVADSLVAAPPAKRFAGAKPDAWTRWVLEALSFDPATDSVADLFPGSGGVTAVVDELVCAAADQNCEQLRAMSDDPLGLLGDLAGLLEGGAA